MCPLLGAHIHSSIQSCSPDRLHTSLLNVAEPPQLPLHNHNHMMSAHCTIELHTKKLTYACDVIFFQSHAISTCVSFSPCQPGVSMAMFDSSSATLFLSLKIRSFEKH